MKVAQYAAAQFQRYVRVAAILDSDRLLPGTLTSSHAKADELAAVGVVVHVLELREAENYVPNRVLRGCGKPREAARRLDLLKTLASQQRGYFDMKRGFNAAGSVPAEQKELFADLDSRVLIGLSKGFGNHLLRRLWEMRSQLTEHDFASLGTDVSAEIHHLLGQVARVI